MTRKSKREIARGVGDLEGEDPPVAGIISVLSAHHNGGRVEPVPGRPDRIRIDGEVRRLLPNAREKLEGWGERP